MNFSPMASEGSRGAGAVDILRRGGVDIKTVSVTGSLFVDLTV